MALVHRIPALPLTPGPLSRTMDDEPPLNSDLSFSLQDVFVCSEVDVESEIKNRTFYRLRFKNLNKVWFQ